MLLAARSRLAGYTVAIVASGVALLLTLALHPVLEPSVFVLFFAGVVFSAWYGGLGPGLLATLLATLATSYFFLSPGHSFAVAALNDWFRLSMFVVAAVLTSLLQEERRKSVAAQLRAVQEQTDREAAQHAEATLRALLESVPDAMVTVDRNGSIVYANTMLQEIFGYRSEELSGQPVEVLVPEHLQARHIQHRQRYFAAPHARPMGSGLELMGRRKDRTQFPVEVSLNTVTTVDGVWITAAVRDITERKQTEEALDRLRRRTELILARAGEGIYGIDNQGITTFVNPAAARMLGYQVEDIQGRPMHPILHHSRPDGTPYPVEECPIYAAFRDGAVHRVDHEVFWRRDGSSFPVEYVSTPIYENGALVGAVVVFQDVTARKQAEEELRHSETFVRATLNALSAHIAILDEQGTILAVNQAWRDFAAANAPTLKDVTEGTNYLQVCDNATGPSAEEAPVMAEAIRAVLRGTLPSFILEYPCHAPEEERWFLARITRFPQDEPPRVVVAHENITKRKRAEARLRASEERYRNIVETALEGIWVADTSHRLTFVNSRMADILGYTVEEMLGVPTLQFVDDAYQPVVRSKQQDRERGMSDQYDIKLRRKDGAGVWAILSVRPLFDQQGRFSGVLGMVTEITARKHAEEALRFLNTRLQALTAASRSLEEASLDMQAALDATVRRVAEMIGDLCVIRLVSEDGQWLTPVALHHATPEADTYLRALLPMVPHRADEGYTGIVIQTGQSLLLAEVAQEEFRQRIRPEYREYVDRYSVHSFVIVPLRVRGRMIGTMSVSRGTPGAPYTEDDRMFLQELADHAALAIDNARLYQELQRSLHTRDEFLAAAAHDLKTPLTAIKGFAQSMQRQATRSAAPDAPRLANGLQQIATITTKMNGQINELLDIARLQMGQQLTLEYRAVDLVTLARQAVAEHQQTTEAHTLRLEATVPELVGTWDPARLERVLGNLLSNAVKYSPNGGEVLVTVAEERDAAGQWAVLRVQDHGLGIPAEDVSRVFERFQRAGNVMGRIAGTGIGLAGTRWIVEHHGGQIALESQEHIGTTVTVRLPLTSAAAQHSPAA